MSDDRLTQAHLDLAEADLEAKISQLKEVVVDKLETPRQVVERVEAAIAWVRANPRLAIGGAVAGLAVLLIARRLTSPRMT